MTATYYFIVFCVNVLLSMVGKNALLLPTAFIALGAALSSAAGYNLSGVLARFLSFLPILCGGALAIYGSVSGLHSTLPLLEYTVILMQGICGLLVSFSEPVIERLEEETK